MRVQQRLIGICSLALLIVGCGGGDGEGSAPQPATGTNTPPTIQGQPAQSALVGQAYSFQANATDANGDPLTFTAANLPAWLSLNASTGRLTGTPAAGDIGTYAGITITVSDGRASTSLGAFSILVSDSATGSATLSWTAPALNTDGTSLTDLSGFRIHYGRNEVELSESVVIQNPSISTYVLENLSSGEWFFAVTAVNSAGVESALSSVASKTIA